MATETIARSEVITTAIFVRMDRRENIVTVPIRLALSVRVHSPGSRNATKPARSISLYAKQDPMVPQLRRLALASLILFLFTASAGAAIVTGTVTDAATHLPLSGMVVSAYDTTGSLRGTATTDGTGLY